VLGYIETLVIITITLEAKMISLLMLSFKNQWSAQMKKPLEFFIGLFTLIINNSFYLYGIYLLAILSSNDDPLAAKDYLVSTGMVLTSWGLLNVLGGGLYQLGSLIETGELEAYLAKPRSTLLLVAISKSNIMSFGEIIQGVITIIISSILYGLFLGIKMLAISAIMVFAFTSIIIIIGTISFFSSRGSQISYAILQVLLSLSLFPVNRALKGREKWILYFTPLLITATLPRLLAVQEDLLTFLAFIISTMLCLFMGIGFFRFGLKFYKSKNYIFLNE
jgi:ABC-2 type transport system permease protein